MSLGAGGVVDIVFLDQKTLGTMDLSSIKELGNFTCYDTTSSSEVQGRIKNADIIITNKVLLDKASLSCAKNLKLICIAATGTNNVDLSYCKEHNISVQNVTSYSTDSVVQLTYSFIFYFLQNLN
jgi:glycerate dehydrogenase